MAIGWGTILGAASSSGGGGDSGGGDSGGGGLLGTGISGERISQGGMIGDWAKAARAKRDRRLQVRREKELAALQNAANALDVQRAEDRADLAEDLAVSQQGPGLAQYLQGDQLVRTNADEFGPTIRTMLEASQGYQPWMEDDPFLAQTASGRQAVEGSRQRAGEFAHRGIYDWEQSQEDIARDYTRSAAQLEAERQRRVGDFEEKVWADREKRDEDQARTLIDMWIASQSTASIPSPGHSMHGGMDWQGGHGINDRKDKHARSSTKREWIQDQRDKGLSYEAILADPQFAALLMRDPNAGAIARQYLNDRDARERRQQDEEQ